MELRATLKEKKRIVVSSGVVGIGKKCPWNQREVSWFCQTGIYNRRKPKRILCLQEK